MFWAQQPVGLSYKDWKHSNSRIFNRQQVSQCTCILYESILMDEVYLKIQHSTVWKMGDQTAAGIIIVV